MAQGGSAFGGPGGLALLSQWELKTSLGPLMPVIYTKVRESTAAIHVRLD